MTEERHCVTCSDAATAMRVVEIDAPRCLAVCVDAEGRRQQVDVGLLAQVDAGDTLLVHAGAALHRESA